MDIPLKEVPQGRQLIGTYGGVEQVRNGEGKPVAGMHEISVVEERPDRQWKHSATFFETDRESDEVTRMWRSLEAAAPEIGDLVAVRTIARGSISNGKAYANDRAVSITVLARVKAV